MMIPIEILPTIPPPTVKSEVRDIFSEISSFNEPAFEQRNQNECKFQNIYVAQRPVNLCSQRFLKIVWTINDVTEKAHREPTSLAVHIVHLDIYFCKL